MKPSQPAANAFSTAGLVERRRWIETAAEGVDLQSVAPDHGLRNATCCDQPAGAAIVASLYR